LACWECQGKRESKDLGVCVLLPNGVCPCLCAQTCPQYKKTMKSSLPQEAMGTHALKMRGSSSNTQTPLHTCTGTQVEAARPTRRNGQGLQITQGTNRAAQPQVALSKWLKSRMFPGGWSRALVLWENTATQPTKLEEGGLLCTRVMMQISTVKSRRRPAADDPVHTL
jgi:hypothetical protein